MLLKKFNEICNMSKLVKFKFDKFSNLSKMDKIVEIRKFRQNKTYFKR